MKKEKKILFIGSKKIGLLCLKEMYDLIPNSLNWIVTLDDRNDTRSIFNEFIKFSESKKIPRYIAKNKKETEQIIWETRPDICFVIGWYWLFSPKILKSVPQGFIGVHNSLLPKYRGCAPLVWSIMNGDNIVGVSLFQMNENMDDGPIWGQKSCHVEKDMYISNVLEKIEEMAVSLIIEKYIAIVANATKPRSQNNSKATYCAQRIPHDGLIDWNCSSEKIFNFIRAQSEPYPGAFTYYNNRKLTIWRAQPLDIKYFGSIGQIAKISSDGVFVICGDQKPMLLKTVQPEGGKKMNAKDMIKSIKTRL